MTDLAAAIGSQQLRKVERFRQKRECMVRKYDEAFMASCVRPPQHAPTGDLHAWHLYVLRLADDAPVSRNQFIDEMSRAKIGTSVHFIPLHMQPYWREKYGLRCEAFPVATKAFEQAVSLPLYTRMTEHEQDRVIETAQALLTGVRHPELHPVTR